ncbi:MAG TPA: hypothetical protein VI112_06890 [Bacteroidia bacterium]|jgi:hypothetical protein
MQLKKVHTASPAPAEEMLFEEKQYLGYNKFSIIRRMILSFFCFGAYYWSQNPKPVDVSGIHIGSYPIEVPHSGELFFLLGVILLIISGLMIFVLHLHTTVTDSKIVLIGLWTRRMVKIDMRNIVNIKMVRFGNLNLKQPVYNLHYKGKIRFYTSGEDGVEITDKDGTVYRIGSHRASELMNTIASRISS